MKKLVYISLAVVLLFIACSDNDKDEPEVSVSVPTEASYTLSNSPRLPHKSTKRGLCYDFKNHEVADMKLVGNSISWFYNWGAATNKTLAQASAEYGIEFSPMCWNGSYNPTTIVNTAELYGNCQYLLAFNEPNLTDQANMTPQQAATLWPTLLQTAHDNNLKIVSPAMNYGTLSGYGDPEVWLDEFFSLIDASDIAAISVHCYMPSVAALKSYIEKFEKYGKPIWLTEFCAWDGFSGSAEEQMQYMSEAINYLEASPIVERYAWFIARTSNANAFPYMSLLTDNQTTNVGSAYLAASTQDTTVYAIEGQQIEAERFVRCNASDVIGSHGQYSATVHYRPTTDAKGNLDVYHFGIGQWLEYQIEVENDGEYDIQLRCNPMVKTILHISIDGADDGEAEVSKTNAWSTTHYITELCAGKHTLRLTVQSGNTAMNYIVFEPMDN